MAYQPFSIQKQAHRALLVDNYRRALLYWSRRCFAAGTPVKTASGVEVPIENIRPGMWVVSYNEELGITEPKEVLELHCFGVDQDPKPMIQFRVNGKTITSTYDHEFYTDRGWIPCHQLTWGALAPGQRVQLELLCQQYGKALDNETLRRLRNGSNEASTRRFWVLQNADGRSNDKGSQGSSPDMGSESLGQTPGQSHRPQPSQQSDRQPGMGNEGRERGPYDEGGSPNQELRREMRDAYPNRPTGMGDIILSETLSSDEQTGDVQGFGPEIPSLFRINPPYFEGQNLEISEARVRESQLTYDLTVADNHNYTVHNLLVHNTGKTLWSVQQLLYSCMLHQGPHHIVFKEYQQAETVAWNQYIHLIPKGLIKDLNKSTLTVTFNHFEGTVKLPEPIGTVTLHPDYDKPPASIRLLGSDKADSHRGGESYGMIFDEYQDQDTYGWDFVYKYFLATTNGWAAFMGTANSDDWWNEMLDRAEANFENYPKGHLQDSDDETNPVNQRWYFNKATWRENPLIQPSWIASERKQAEDEQKLGPFLQETELIPFTQQGAVYPMFNKQIHVIKPTEVPDEGTEYIALDFGFAEGHPMAACFIRITRDDVWYQWDEIHGTGIQIDDLCAEIRVKMGDRQLTGIVADSARPDLIEYMQSKGFPVIPSPKKQNSIVSGIQLLSKRLRPKIQILGEPKPNYYVTNNCKGTIYDWQHYRYKEIKQNRHPQEIPDKKYDDSLDAIRYLELFMKFGLQKDDRKKIESSVVKDLNAYGLL